MAIRIEVPADVLRLKHFIKSYGQFVSHLEEQNEENFNKVANNSKCVIFWTLTVKQAWNLHFVVVALH